MVSPMTALKKLPLTEKTLSDTGGGGGSVGLSPPQPAMKLIVIAANIMALYVNFDAVINYALFQIVCP